MVLNLAKVLPVSTRLDELEEEEVGIIIKMKVEVEDDVFVSTIIYE